VFETILYAALWRQGNGGTILAGALSACAALALIAWAMLRYSRRLPIGKFFTYSRRPDLLRLRPAVLSNRCRDESP
jgi:high-affinity iron transporter